MTKTEQSLLKSFVVFVLLVAIGTVAAVRYRREPPVAAEAYSIEPIPRAAVQETSVNSSKADKKLILRETPHDDGTTTYEYVIDSIRVFTKTLGSGQTMTLPYNAWDPTDTYIFVEEKTGGAPDYYVVKISDGSVIDVGAVWREKNIPFSIRTATGWASGTLLIIYTSASDGSKGPAYWFEIPSTAILQLAG